MPPEQPITPPGGPQRIGVMPAAASWTMRHALLVVGLAVLVTAACGAYVARHFAIDTDLETLLSPDLPFQRDAAAFARAFPQLQNSLVVVLDGPTPALARDGARRLADRLGADRTMFPDVYLPESAFLVDHGLLYLEPAQLEQLTDQLAQAQPLIGALAANRGVAGLAALVGQAVSPEAAQAGVDLAGFGPVLGGLAETVEASDQGRFRPMAWSRLMQAGDPAREGARQFLVLRPKLDIGALEPAAPATDAVRRAAAEIGLDAAHGFRLRLTGQAALDAAQVKAATEGATGAALLTLGLLVVLLVVGLYSLRIPAAILIVLAMSFLWSAALALLVVGPFNLISSAFAVLFIGLGVDFGIQFAVRYGEDRAAHGARRPALEAALRGAARPLSLAAAAAAISFYATAPTHYSGLAALGVVAGTSMIVALAGTLFVLPALIALIGGGRRHRGCMRYGGFGRLPLHRHSRAIAVAALLAGLAALPLALRVGFDADPATVQDPRSEAVQAFDDIRRADPASLYTVDVLAPDEAAAEALAARLSRLPTVAQALTVASYVPEDQDAKLAAIQQLATIIPPFTLTLPPPAPAAAARDALAEMRARLGQVPAAAPFRAEAARLAGALDGFLRRHGGDDAAVLGLQQQMIGDLPQTIDTLRRSLSAGPVSLADLPADLRTRYVNPRTGEARVEVFSKLGLTTPEQLDRFVREVQSVAPRATGTSVIVVETGRAVVAAFRTSTLLAALGIFVLLFLVLRDVGRVLLVLLPLVLAGVLTLATMRAFGIAFNLGNIIVLPLLIGLGVAFGIYFVLRWADGAAVQDVLRTSMPDAVLLSGLATMVSFGSMALSANPAMAILGRTLSIALFYVLLSVLVVLPSVLAIVQARAAWRAAASLHDGNSRQ